MNSTRIKSIHAREILDSRGNPTVEVDVELHCGILGRAAVPSGASTGSYEAVELRDSDKQRYNSRGVLTAVHNVNFLIAKELCNKNADDHLSIDKLLCSLDGTANKSRLGANAILGVSMAIARAVANAQNTPLYKYLGSKGGTLLPVPMFNIINGGVHAQWQSSDVQEYMIAPFNAPTFREAVRWGSEIYQELGKILRKHGQTTGVGDEGGYIPKVSTNLEPINFIIDAIKQAGYEPSQDVGIAIDAASNGFYQGSRYNLKTENRKLSSEEMVEYYLNLTSAYPILLIEDGMSENDWDGWQLLNSKLGHKIKIVGDDLFVTNIERIKKGISQNVANSVLIKLNQIGTVTETIEAIKLTQNNKWSAVVSHRSGETVDSFIADLTVAMNTGLIKSGAPCRGERVEKYNQLLRIEEELGQNAIYAGLNAFIH